MEPAAIAHIIQQAHRVIVRTLPRRITPTAPVIAFIAQCTASMSRKPGPRNAPMVRIASANITKALVPTMAACRAGIEDLVKLRRFSSLLVSGQMTEEPYIPIIHRHVRCEAAPSSGSTCLAVRIRGHAFVRAPDTIRVCTGLVANCRKAAPRNTS